MVTFPAHCPYFLIEISHFLAFLVKVCTLSPTGNTVTCHPPRSPRGGHSDRARQMLALIVPLQGPVVGHTAIVKFRRPQLCQLLFEAAGVSGHRGLAARKSKFFSSQQLTGLCPLEGHIFFINGVLAITCVLLNVREPALSPTGLARVPPDGPKAPCKAGLAARKSPWLFLLAPLSRDSGA